MENVIFYDDHYNILVCVLLRDYESNLKLCNSGFSDYYDKCVYEYICGNRSYYDVMRENNHLWGGPMDGIYCNPKVIGFIKASDVRSLYSVALARKSNFLFKRNKI